MSDIAIRVENLGKQYKIGRLQKRNDTLRDALANRLSRIANRKSNAPNGDMPSAIRDTPSAVPTQSSVLAPQSSEFIWALRDVSFEVKRGEMVGIPSTLLRKAARAQSRQSRMASLDAQN